MSDQERERTTSTDRERVSPDVEAHRATATANEEPTDETTEDDVEAHRTTPKTGI